MWGKHGYRITKEIAIHLTRIITQLLPPVVLITLGCPHCKKIKPEYSSAAKKVNTENKVEGAMGAVDCATETNLCKEQEVKGYPTCKYFFTSCPGKPCLAAA